MRFTKEGLRVDALQVFAVSVATALTGLLFLVSVLAGVSLDGALWRAMVSWAVLSALGIGVALLVRWLLKPTGPSAPRREWTA